MLCCCSCQRGSLPRHATPSSLLLGVRAISIFYQFIQFLGAVADGEVERMFTFISLFHLFSDLAKHPAGQPRSPPTAFSPSSSAPPPPPSGSRGGRPVSAKPIGKQNPKIYLPVSSPSPMSKHSNRSQKNAVAAIFAYDDLLSSFRCVLHRENLTNLKIYDIIYLQGEGRKMNLHHLHYA